MQSKRNIFLGAAILVFILGTAAFYFLRGDNSAPNNGAFNDASPAAATIIVDAKGFHPDTITIKQGDRVRWKNNDTASHWPASNLHPTHEIYPEFDPQEGIPAGKDWSFVFTKRGKWFFHDHLNPLWQGSVTVE